MVNAVRLNIPQVSSQSETDLALQNALGLEGNYVDTREQVAADLRAMSEDFTYNAAVDAMLRGAPTQSVVDYFYNSPQPQITRDNSLEYALVNQELEKGLQNNSQTYENFSDPDTDPDEFIGQSTLEMKLNEAYTAIDNSLKDSPISGVSDLFSAVVSGAEGDMLTINNLKEKLSPIIPGLENAKLFSDIEDAFKEKLKSSMTEGTFNEFLKSYTDTVVSMDDRFSRIKGLEILKDGASLDDYFNILGFGLSAFSSPKNLILSSKIGGDKVTTLHTVVKNKDTHEMVPSVVKKAATNDATVTYSNDDVISRSLTETLTDDHLMGLKEKFANSPERLSKDIDLTDYVNRTYDTNFKKDYLDVTDIVDMDNGNSKVTMLFGNGVDKNGAMTQRGVDNLAESLGITDYKAVKKDGAGYYLQTSFEVPTNIITPGTAEFGVKGFGRVFYGSSNMPEWFHREAITGYRKASRMEETLFKEYGSKFRNLSKAEATTLNDLFEEGQKMNNGLGAWINVSERARKGLISDAVAEAYQAFRKVSDLDYIIANENMWNKMNKLGYVSDIDDDVVKVIREGAIKTKGYSNMVIKNGSELITSTTHSAQQVDDLIKGSGSVLVEVAPVSKKGKMLNYTHKILQPSQLSKTLNRRLLPYRAGGRRRYPFGTNFLRIGNTMVINGEKVNAYSTIIGAVQDAKVAKAKAEELNKALRLIRDMESGDTTVAQRLVRNPLKNINISNTDDLKRLRDSGIDWTQDVQVLKRGETMTYNNGLRTLFEDPLDFDDAFYDMAIAQGNYYSRRGHILDDLIGNQSRIVDIYDIFDQTIKRASTNNALSNLFEEMGQIFKNKYIDLVDTRAIRNPRTLSGVDLLRYSRLKEFNEVGEVMHQQLREAKGLQNMFKRLANVPTEGDRYVQSYMNRMANTFVDHKMISDKTGKWLATKDPAAMARSLMYHTTLGSFNLKQLWAQGTGALTMGLAHPVLFTRAMLATPFVWAGYAARNVAPVFTEIMNGFTRMFGGIGEDTFKNLIRYMDEYGTTMGTYRAPMVDPYRLTRGVGDTLFKISSGPVELGTKYANIVNDVMAFLENGGKDWKKIAARADDFAMNQTRATMSAYQAGQYAPTRTLAQFTQWTHRVLENMTVNKRFTTREKMAIFGGQVMMWGLAGTLFTSPEYKLKLNEMVQSVDMPEDVKNVLRDGFFDTTLKELFGVSANEGIGGGKLTDAVVDSLFTLLGDNKLESIELPGAMQFPQRLYSAVITPMKVLGFAFDPEAGAVAAEDLAVSLATDKYAPTGIRNISRAFLMAGTGRLYNTSGDLISDKATEAQAVGRLFGMSTKAEVDYQTMYTVYTDYKKTLDTFFEDTVKKTYQKLQRELPDDIRRTAEVQLDKEIDALLYLAQDTYSEAGYDYANNLVRKMWRYGDVSKEEQTQENLKSSRQIIQDMLQFEQR